MLVLQIFLWLSISRAVYGLAPSITLYDEWNQEGNQITLTSSADLFDQNFDNKARSFCVQGFFLLYDKAHFNGNVEHVYGETRYCTNVRYISGRIVSVRFAGSSTDIQRPAFSGYPNIRFHLCGQIATREVPLIYYWLSSIIITGSSNWTVYDQFSYTGNSICLVPAGANGTPSYIDSFWFPHLTFGSVLSAKLGCDSEVMQKIHLTNFPIHDFFIG